MNLRLGEVDGLYHHYGLGTPDWSVLEEHPDRDARIIGELHRLKPSRPTTFSTPLAHPHRGASTCRTTPRCSTTSPR